MPRSPIRTLHALRERDVEGRITALAEAQEQVRNEEAAREAAERARAEHEQTVRGEVRAFEARLDAGACTVAELERLASYTLGATLRDRAHAETVAHHAARHSAALESAEAARGALAAAKVASRVIGARADADDRAEAKRIETLREEDP